MMVGRRCSSSEEAKPIHTEILQKLGCILVDFTLSSYLMNQKSTSALYVQGCSKVSKKIHPFKNKGFTARMKYGKAENIEKPKQFPELQMTENERRKGGLSDS